MPASRPVAKSSPSMTTPERPTLRQGQERPTDTMSDFERRAPAFALKTFPVATRTPALDDATRTRLGRELRALYDPVIDEPLDPRLAELLDQLAVDRSGPGA